MITGNEENKRMEFVEFLTEFASSQELLSSDDDKRQYLDKLKSIYFDPDGNLVYRHYYSDIFGVASQINMGIIDGNLETLSQNMEIMKTFCESIENQLPQGLLKSIKKLYDHVNLDAARLNYYTQLLSETNSKMVEVEEKIVEIKCKDEFLDGKIKEAANTQKNYITILGIFASIVLAFTGGIAFSTSVLENIDSVSPFRLALVVLGLAFILVNIVYILTRFIQEISKEKSEKIKYPVYMIVLNVIMCALAVTVISGYFANLKYGIIPY